MPPTEPLTSTESSTPDGSAPCDPVAAPRTSRYPFHRKWDYVAVVLIVVATLVVGLVVWARSDIRHTTLTTAADPGPPPAEPTVFPPSLAQIWERPSADTPVPVIAGSDMVTGDGDQVVGRDPLTGAQRWSYTRDLGLCTVGAAWNDAIAIYRRGTHCSEVTALDGNTGTRTATRDGDAQDGTTVVTDGNYVTATGPTLLDTWRSDLVQTMEYGDVPDFVNPNRQPRSGCTYGSVAAAEGTVGVIERCTGDAGDRLTAYRAMNKEADTPSVLFSTVVGDHGARLVALNDHYAAVLVPNPTRLAVFDARNGDQVMAYPLSLPASDLGTDPPGRLVAIATGAGSIYWFTGSQTVSLSAGDFHPQWTIAGTLGPGTVFAGRYLVPVPGGLVVLDPTTGAQIGEIAVDRHGYSGTVRMASLGPVVFEQRGPVLAALR